MKTISKFFHLQNTQLTDGYNNILIDDILSKDGTVLRFDKYGYLDGLIECGNGQIEYWKHGKLHGLPAVIKPDLSYKEYWQNGLLIKCENI